MAIPSFNFDDLKNETMNFPMIAKPAGGRSSEGLLKVQNMEHIINAGIDVDDYIFQPIINGDIITVDYIRSKEEDVVIARKELIRTKNGAGIVVDMISDVILNKIVKEIGRELDLIGCVNIEFIYNTEGYHLLDFNPRFSAGIAFSIMAGYNFPLNL